jgi:hypothetical protein
MTTEGQVLVDPKVAMRRQRRDLFYSLMTQWTFLTQEKLDQALDKFFELSLELEKRNHP